MWSLLHHWMTDNIVVLAGGVQPNNSSSLNPSGISGSAYGEGLAGVVKAFIAPLLMLVIGIIAMTFLFKRQLTQFFQFIAIAVLVGVFFYTNAAETLARWVAGFFGGS